MTENQATLSAKCVGAFLRRFSPQDHATRAVITARINRGSPRTPPVANDPRAVEAGRAPAGDTTPKGVDTSRIVNNNNIFRDGTECRQCRAAVARA